MVALRDLEPEAWDRQESLGEANAMQGEPDSSHDSFWMHLAKEILGIPPDREDT